MNGTVILEMVVVAREPAAHSAELAAIREVWPDIGFHALREHSGFIFQSRLAA